MNSEELNSVQTELKKRHEFPYRWFRQQNDRWDSLSNFIYAIKTWEDLQKEIYVLSKKEKLPFQEFFQYASNRWYNFHSAEAVESVFKNLIVLNQGNQKEIWKKDREKDFYLSGIPFDHKTSVFPKGFRREFFEAKDHKHELIEWFYKNQSRGKRFHLKNRLFVVVYNQNGNHWKLKAELWLIKMNVEKYILNFDENQLYSFSIRGETPKSDIIWVYGNLY